MTPSDLRQRTIIVLGAVFVFVLAFKFFYFRYAPGMLIPVSGYKVEINAEIECGAGEVKVLGALPSANFRQSIFDEKENTAVFGFTSYDEDGQRFGRWETNLASGRYHRRNIGMAVLRYSL